MPTKSLWIEELDRAADLFEIMGEERFLFSRELCMNCLTAVLGLLKDFEKEKTEEIAKKYPFLDKIKI